MEEYLTAKEKTSQFFTSEGSITKPNPQDQQWNSKLNFHRHVSLLYGLQFQSKIALFAKEHSKNTTLTNFQQLPKEELYKKVLSFLKLVVQDSSVLEEFIKSFKILDEEMQLQIKKSTQSIHSQSSEISLNSDSDKGSDKKVRQVLTEMVNSCSPLLIIEAPALRRAKTSMMSKSNRISIAQAINISQLQKLKKIEAIQSQESIQSKKSSSFEIKSRNVTSFENVENLSDKDSFTDIKTKGNRENKISITMLQDCYAGSELFSQTEVFLSLSDIRLPKLSPNQVMLQVFFDPPSPYLVNLALCLFCKCLSRGQIVLKLDSVGWLLGVSTIVAYKLYYDEPIQGLIEWFCEGMSMESSELVKLERWFLGSLNYEAAVSSQQFNNMLTKLMANK